MTFVLLFVIGTFAVPLAMEIYQRGSDNVVTRSGREIMQSTLVANATGWVTGLGKNVDSFATGSMASLRSVSNFAAGFISFIGLLIVGAVIWKILSLFVWLIRSLLGS